MNTAETYVYPCTSTMVAIICHNGEFKVVATQPISKGESILIIEGRETHIPSKYSVQITSNLHIDLDDPNLVDQYPERYLWRFLNHRCEPNGALRGRILYAVQHIDVGDEITFNYNTNEYEMAEPFECWCPAHINKEPLFIQGYKYLTEAERAHIAPLVSDHIRNLTK